MPTRGPGRLPEGPGRPRRGPRPALRAHPNLWGDLSAGSGANAIGRDREFGRGVPAPPGRPPAVRHRLPEARPGRAPVRAAGRLRPPRRGPRRGSNAGTPDPTPAASEGSTARSMTPRLDGSPLIGDRAGHSASGLSPSIRGGGEDDLAGELPRIKPLDARRGPRSRSGSTGVPPRAGGGRAAGDRPGERLLRRRRPALRRRDARLSLPRERRPPATSAGSRTATATAGSTRSTIFVDGLSWPTGVVPYDGGVFIAVAPDILYAKDTDGDGVADVKKVMFTGFGTENVQALLNGLLWGPGRLDLRRRRAATAARSATRRGPTPKPVSVRGRDFRFKPDGSAFEAISGGGQFGHALRRLGPPLHLQQQQPHPPDRPARRATWSGTRRWSPRRCSPTSPPKGRRRRSSGSARPSPGGSSGPASARPTRRCAKRLPADRAGRHRLLHLGHRRHDLPGDGLSRPSIAATPSSATSAATSSIARSSPRTARSSWPRRADRGRRVPRLDRQLVPARSTSPTRPTARC